MRNNLLKELNEIKYLFGYERGRVISEQKSLVSEDFEEIGIYEDDTDYSEFSEEIDVPVMLPGTKEKERIITPGTKPGPKTPYRPKPGPKKNPKARKGDMPDWLTFDKLGINLR